MVVKGLKSFFCTDVSQVEMLHELRHWRRNNSEKTPLIVIDLISFTVLSLDSDVLICGGRHEFLLEIYEKFLMKIFSTGAKLVFFVNLRLKKELSNWLRNQNGFVQTATILFDKIASGEPLPSILSSMRTIVSTKLSSETLLFQCVALKFGEIRYAIDRDIHMEMAKFALNNDAFAVVTNSTNFYIYPGNWRWWGISHDLIFRSKNLDVIEVCEFDRKVLLTKFSFKKHHLPLFASLMGDDVTQEFLKELDRFHTQIGRRREKIYNVAKFVRRTQGDKEHLTKDDLTRIAHIVFENDDQKWVTLLEDSIALYDLSYEDEKQTPFEKRLFTEKTRCYQDYQILTRNIQVFSLIFYDVRGHPNSHRSLSQLFIHWVKRKIGVIRQHYNDDAFTLVVLAKLSFEEPFCQMVEKPIYPDFDVPSYEDLYLKEENLEMKWKILSWIMELSENAIQSIKSCSDELRLVVTTLLIMVKEKFCTVEQADGLLLAEHMVRVNKDMVLLAETPYRLTEINVRVAHMYILISLRVRENFSISGLLSTIENVPLFDGVYFQNIMKFSPEKRIEMLGSCVYQRIYAGL